MNNRKNLTIAALLLSAMASAQVRESILLDEGWQFSRDKAAWQEVSVPHDWAISGPFDKKWDLQFVAIEQNGEKEKTEKSGRSGSLPWIGKGYYKRTFNIPAGYTHAELMFDGAMSEPNVIVNGKHAGYWAYGYNAFKLDISNLVKVGENTLEVELNNVEESSRWYPGGGIYRPVTLLLRGDKRIVTWETFARTTSVADDKAFIDVDTKVEGVSPDDNAGVEIALYDKRGMVTGSRCEITADGRIKAVLDVNKPQLWSPESPHLYKLVTRLYKDNKLEDEQVMNFGIRTISITKENGFQLNGKTRKFKGVCLHHDLGPLGAAVNKAALIRQVKMMKAMGADAIRTAHNMPSQMQMDVCDSLGMMVMAESFDMWVYPKCKNGYARFFNEWAEKDITNLILGHRNHPSIVMWSIGNEIPEQGNKQGLELSKKLQDLCHKLDPTRPVTQGLDRIHQATKSGVAQAMDVVGINYRLHRYEQALKDVPQGIVLGSETASTISSRGTYKFPVEIYGNNKTYPDGQISGYDTEHCSWSNLPDDDWRWQDDDPRVIGEFVWTGYDYLGEPTPYDLYWPSRSSYFGICDLAGLPKDRYFLYRSKWNTKDHTTHILPHWTWPGREGEVTPVYCYTDGVEGELFVNGKSQGRVKKNEEGRLDRYRLRWNNVKYEPGEIKVIAYDAQGNKVGEDVKRTAGEPEKFVLSAECQNPSEIPTLYADGKDMAFVTVSMIDKDGVSCPTADDELTFEVSGAGTFQAVCNGDATSLEPFTESKMKLFAGQLVVLVKSGKTPGIVTLKVTNAKRGISQTIDIKVI